MTLEPLYYLLPVWQQVVLHYHYLPGTSSSCSYVRPLFVFLRAPSPSPQLLVLLTSPLLSIGID